MVDATKATQGKENKLLYIFYRKKDNKYFNLIIFLYYFLTY